VKREAKARDALEVTGQRDRAGEGKDPVKKDKEPKDPYKPKK